MPSITLHATKDTRIVDSAPTLNYGVNVQIGSGENNLVAPPGNTQRILIAFDLSSIPPGSVITTANLKLTITVDRATNTRTHRVFRVKRAWTEGTGDGAATGDGATWNTYDGSNNWQTAGGFGSDDCEQTDIGSLSLTGSESGTKTWALTPTTKEALDLGNGWLIKADTELDDLWVFDSRHATNIPTLDITWTSPTIQVEVLTGSDTFIESLNNTTNFGTNTAIQIGDALAASVENIRTLIKFDLSSIPASAIIQAAAILLYEGSAAGTGSWEILVQRLLRNWVVGQATWEIYSSGNNWSTAGAASEGNDRSSTISARGLGDATAPSAYVIFSSPTLVDDVQKMLRGTYDNYGWLIHAPQAETSNPARRTIWNAFDHGTSATRPKLFIAYTFSNYSRIERGVLRGILRGAR